jgi:hypothetical protein
MSGRVKKISLLLLTASLLFGVSRVQDSLNRDRDRLGLTHAERLENAPPGLAFTTMALGGFRGLISNWLWMRASDLQEDDKFFEAVQLSDWITQLEPHFSQVWVHEAWNMAFNISVKFKDFEDRWRWVRRGIELLRDEGLRYNPNDVLIHRELAWFFQFKMGANLDDASMYYKQEWLYQMMRVFGKGRAPDLEELVHPQTDDARRRQEVLTNEFKMDPAFMQHVDQRWGPLEWRLPEAHAIYWAARGLKKAEENPAKIDPDTLIQLRRVIYQSMQLSFLRGRLETNAFSPEGFEFGPNLDIIQKTSDAYTQAMEEDEKNRDHIEKAYRNFLRQAIYALYLHDRRSEAEKWFRVLGEKFPDKPIIDNVPDSLPRNLTLDEYAVACVQEDVNETNRDKVKSTIEGLLKNSYVSLILGRDDRSAGYRALANKVWAVYQGKIPKERESAIGLPSPAAIARQVLGDLLGAQSDLPPEARAVLRARVPQADEISPPASTNSVNAPK